ncbi:CLUMA_CG012768, isoform A [Clunio marinus]|uniref:CLUMA_CG012768, isoform A n=1 Tax=Clunio marinus TaxID=568069 RepID=A0A1J1IGS6_9DIPT|nr:CLUMA_CG012768, isoform A [Clunio marinus]
MLINRVKDNINSLSNYKQTVKQSIQRIFEVTLKSIRVYLESSLSCMKIFEEDLLISYNTNIRKYICGLCVEKRAFPLYLQGVVTKCQGRRYMKPQLQWLSKLKYISLSQHLICDYVNMEMHGLIENAFGEGSPCGILISKKIRFVNHQNKEE